MQVSFGFFFIVIETIKIIFSKGENLNPSVHISTDKHYNIFTLHNLIYIIVTQLYYLTMYVHIVLHCLIVIPLYN